MADEPTYSFEQYTYNQKLRLYNSAGRENVGASDIWDPQKGHLWDTQGATMGLFTIDTTQDVVDPITLCSFQNGVKIVYTYDHTSFDPGGGGVYDPFSISLRIALLDKDDIEINYYYLNNVYFSYQYYTTTSAQFYYTPPSFEYALTYSDNPIRLSSGGSIFSASGYKALSTYPPDITNQLVDVKKVQDYWTRHTITIGSNTDLNDFMNLIITHGDGEPITPKKPEDDPSGPSIGDPDYDPTSDPVPFPTLPTGGDSISTGFIRVYNPTSAQLQSLAGVLWGNDFIDTIKKIQNDPMEAIISLHSIPFDVVGSASTCQVGNFNTGVAMNAITTQFYTVDLGSIYIPEHWSSALDYSPYTNIDCYIPFVGVIQMQVDDIIGRVVSIKFNVDVLSGATLVSIMCGNSVLYTFNTNVILRHPISQSSYGPLYQSILGMVGSIASGVSTGGSGGAVGGAIGGALNVAMSKHSSVSRGGTIGGATGVLGSFYPYLIIHRPKQSLASGFRHFKGYPSNITTTLSSVSGYTEVESIHLTGISCTDQERDEIMALLYNGVII